MSSEYPNDMSPEAAEAYAVVHQLAHASPEGFPTLLTEQVVDASVRLASDPTDNAVFERMRGLTRAADELGSLESDHELLMPDEKVQVGAVSAIAKGVQNGSLRHHLAPFLNAPVDASNPIDGFKRFGRLLYHGRTEAARRLATSFLQETHGLQDFWIPSWHMAQNMAQRARHRFDGLGEATSAEEYDLIHGERLAGLADELQAVGNGTSGLEVARLAVRQPGEGELPPLVAESGSLDVLLQQRRIIAAIMHHRYSQSVLHRKRLEPFVINKGTEIVGYERQFDVCKGLSCRQHWTELDGRVIGANFHVMNVYPGLVHSMAFSVADGVLVGADSAVYARQDVGRDGESLVDSRLLNGELNEDELRARIDALLEQNFDVDLIALIVQLAHRKREGLMPDTAGQSAAQLRPPIREEIELVAGRLSDAQGSGPQLG